MMEPTALVGFCENPQRTVGSCGLLWAAHVGCLCGLRCFTVRTRVIVDVDNKTSRSRNFFVYTIKK